MAAGATVPALAAEPPPDAYIDGSLGFWLRPPADWQLLRERRAEPGGLLVLRMVKRAGPARVHEITLHQRITPRSMGLDEALSELTAALRAESRGLRIAEQAELRRADRPAAFLSAEHESPEGPMILLTAMVRARPSMFYVLTYAGPAASRAEIEPQFRAAAESFQVLEDERSDRLVRQALLAGTDWLNALRPETLSALDEEESYLAVSVDDRPAGYVRVSIEPTTWGGRDGLAVLEYGWTFAPDAPARCVRSEMFVSFDLQSERWQVTTTTLLPAEGDSPASADVVLEEGAREKDRLLTSQQFGPGAPPEANPPLKVPPTYVSRALVRVLPRVIDHLERPRVLAFNEFDPVRRGLILRSVEILGAADPPVPVRGGKCFALRDREGLFGRPNDVFVDHTGRVRAVVSGSLKMKPADRTDLEKRYAQRVAEAERTVQELLGEYVRAQERFSRP